MFGHSCKRASDLFCGVFCLFSTFCMSFLSSDPHSGICLSVCMDLFFPFSVFHIIFPCVDVLQHIGTEDPTVSQVMS